MEECLICKAPLQYLSEELALDSIGKNGGPRCCKRDSYLAIISAVEFTRNELGVEMEMSSISCSRSSLNNQCIRERCPFFGKEHYE